MRRYPRINGPAALPLFCLAPHGVFPASRIAPRAVSSYLAFSTLPVPLLPKNRRCLFCDTFRHRNFAIAAPAYFTRHVAVWCSDFPLASHYGSTAIICHQHLTYHNQKGMKGTNNLETIKAGRNEEGMKNEQEINFVASWFSNLVFPDSKGCSHSHKENRDHDEPDRKLADHPSEISEQAPPACSASVDYPLPGDKFSGYRTNNRSNKQSDDSKNNADERTKDSAEHSPFRRAKIFCAEVAADKIERISCER